MVNTTPVHSLFSPEAVRERCNELYHIGIDGRLAHFDIDLPMIEIASKRVVTEITNNYPSLDIPFHSRWRHFEFEGSDLWGEIADREGLQGRERMIAEGDLAVVSVLLDAGAGPKWKYRDDITGLWLGRSEGLALASLRLFEKGFFSVVPEQPLRADALALQTLSAKLLASAMQVSNQNPLVGITQRAALLRRLGEAITARPNVFQCKQSIRPGNLLVSLAGKNNLFARDILVSLLTHLTDIWPSPIRLDGQPLGDVWRHSQLSRADVTDGLVPFHKLSQWLSYSLIEPLQKAGSMVQEPDGLTGLGEYRNGGLFIDAGVIVPKDPATMVKVFKPADELIVEWRALTIALLDFVADKVRSLLGRTVEQLPLASVLQGGTWSAGRRIADELRQNGGPPIRLDSDATVF